jgi:hypothetical protein
VVHTHCQKCHAERNLPAYEDTTISGQGKGGREVDTTIRYPEKEEKMSSHYKRQRFLELEAQKEKIIQTWENCDRKTTAAAKALKMPISSLYAKLQQWELLPTPLSRRTQEQAATGINSADPDLSDELTIIMNDKTAELRDSKEQVAFIQADIDALRRVSVLLLERRTKKEVNND